MASKEFSIKGVLEFLGVDKSVEEIKKFDSAIGAMKANASKISEGAGKVGDGMKTVGLVSAAVGAGLGLAVKDAADFEQAMANINSVNELTTAQFRKLELAALKLGSTTVFSASEAAGGMFELTKAGLTVEQTLQAIPGVLAAAATEGLNLAQASELMVGVLQGQNLQMSEASRVADVLAKTANSTAAGITDLGEAFRYANQLNSAGLLGFEDTAAALGALSNAGLKGSIAGTSLVAMFNQITKPSKDVQKAFGGMTDLISVFSDKATGKMKDLPEMIEIIGQAADAQGTDFMKMAFLSDFVGVEGAKAFSALRRAVTAKDQQGRPMFQGLRQDLENASGTALTVAMKRLDTTSGVISVLGHEIQTLGIMIGKLFLPELKAGATAAVEFMRSIAQVLIAIQKTKEELDANDINLLASPLGQFLQGFVEGIKEAIGIFKSAFTFIIDTLTEFGFITQGNEKDVGALIGKFLVLFTAVAPLVGGLFVLGMAFGAVFNIVQGSILILQGLAGMWGAIMTLAPLLSTAIGAVGSALMFLFANPVGLAILAIAALGAAVYVLWKNWGNNWNLIKEGASAAIDWIIGAFQYLGDWLKTASIGEIILKTILYPIRAALTPLMELIQFLMNTDLAQSIFGKGISGMVKNVASAVSLLPDNNDIARLNQQKTNFNSVSDSPMPVDPNKSTFPLFAQTNEQALEAQRIVAPVSSTQPSEVNVTQAPINLQNEIVVKLDGKELSRQMSKQSVENSERMGAGASNPKNRSMQLSNGQFAPNFGR